MGLFACKWLRALATTESASYAARLVASRSELSTGLEVHGHHRLVAHDPCIVPPRPAWAAPMGPRESAGLRQQIQRLRSGNLSLERGR